MPIRTLLYPIAISIYAIFMYLCHQEVEWGKESVAWPTTQARLIQASYGGKQNALLYSFSVAGKQYKGKRLQFASKNSPELKDYFYSHINNKPEITVSYRPSDPSISVAKPGMDGRKNYFYTFITVAFLIAIVIIEIYVLKYSAIIPKPTHACTR